MERGNGSLLARRIGMIGASLLVVALGLASYRVAAVGPERVDFVPRAKPEREALRYGGKSFDEWRIELVTELKPEIRADGLTAMAAFGANGYGEDAARVIVDLMKGYQLDTKNEKDGKVVLAAFEAIRKIDKPAIPVLWESVRSDNQRIRLFGIACVMKLGEVFEGNFDVSVSKHIPELLKAVKQEGKDVREAVLMRLQDVEDKPKESAALFLDFLKDKEDNVRWAALQNLAGMQSEEPEVLSGLSEAIKADIGFRRGDALELAARYGAKAKPILPALLELLEKPEPDLTFIRVMNALSAIGPAAKEALPRLRKRHQQISRNGNTFTISSVHGKPDVNGIELLEQTIKKIEGK